MKQTRRSRMLCAAAAALVLAAGCSSRPATEEPVDAGGSGVPLFVPAGAGSDEQIDLVTWGILGGVPSVDPARSTAVSALAVIATILEPLVKVNGRGELEPSLAESYEQVDPTTIDITIRGDVTFWDGSPLTAEDAAYSIERMAGPGSVNAGLFGAFESAEVTGDRTLRITLKEPSRDFLYVLCRAVVVQKAFTEAAGEGFGSSAGGVMGTGAYRLDSYSPETGATLVRYDGYWGEAPSAETFEIKVFNDAQALRLALQTGEIDGANMPPLTIPPAEADSWAGPDVTVAFSQGTGTWYLAMDTQQPPFDDLHVRRALASIVDREGIIQVTDGEYGDPMTALTLPPLWTGFVDDPAEIDAILAGLSPLPPYDLDAAAEELAQSAYPDGFSTTVVVPHEANPNMTTVMEVISEAGREVGIDIEVKRVSLAEWSATGTPGQNPPLSLSGQSPTAATPLGSVLQLLRPSPSRWTNYNTPSIDEAIDRYQVAESNDEIIAAAEDVLNELNEQLPLIPIKVNHIGFAYRNEFVVAEDVGQWTIPGSNNWAAAIKPAAG
ncbi:ABC transporter substrate-binding protein [Jiangella anatolica]|uniref:Solute-binding protein family 5 domain-containing protein n=1 Tax=Jiangella anatolica TaxID=2670374 RepID=A0A2W2BKV3_9ACTN|nr:ABC transporter substrate-binding protein [Jiangella anatolica]PZF86642.1 hypothetical protein C1I92_00220 [Jiangella anatolica]